MATLPRTHAIEVLLKSDLESVKKVLLEWMGVLEETEGGVVLRSQADDLDWFARQLAHLPFEFTVLRPRELRDALAACAQRLLKLAAA